MVNENISKVFDEMIDDIKFIKKATFIESLKK